MKIKLVILVMFGLILVTCKKKDEKAEEKLPTASFTTDKASYTEGENIIFTNTSVDAARYRWTIPGGSTSTDKNLTYSIPNLGVDVTYQFKLEAISESGAKIDHMVKDILVHYARGKVTIYSSYPTSVNNISYYINGIYQAELTLPAGGKVPSCGESGYPTIELKAGTYKIDVENVKAVVTVTNNSCTLIKWGI